MLNPITRTSSPEALARYRVEPYVVAADLYSQPPHVGRWRLDLVHRLCRLVIPRRPGRPYLASTWKAIVSASVPAFPSRWPDYEITYRYRSATYVIRVENPNGIEHGLANVTVDSQPCTNSLIDLTDDGLIHQVRVVLG